MSDVDALPAALADARSTTRHVYEVLDAEEWTTDAQLRDRTGYCRHTVSRACRVLQGLDLAARRRNPDDARQVETRLRDYGE